MNYVFLKKYSFFFVCTFLCALAAVSGNVVPIGEVYVLSDLSSSTDLAGSELIATSDNPQIVLAWNLAIENTKDYHIYVEKKGDSKPVYLGRTGSDISHFTWSSSTTDFVHPAFRGGPQDGESYRFHVYALTNGPTPVKGPFSTSDFVVFRIKATPIPTPTSGDQPPLNQVIVTDTVEDTVDLSNGQDTDPESKRELVIRWNLETQDIKDIHLYVSINGKPRVFLGRTGNPIASYYEWKEGSTLVNNIYRQGPQNGNTYQFSIFVLTETGQPRNLGPFSNAGPVKFSVSTPTQSAIAFGSWIENEDGIWTNKIIATSPEGQKNIRICIRFKIAKEYFSLYIDIGNSPLEFPLDISQKDASNTIVEAVLQTQDASGKWTSLPDTLVSSSPGPFVKKTPTPTPVIVKPTPTPTRVIVKPTPTPTSIIGGTRECVDAGIFYTAPLSGLEIVKLGPVMVKAALLPTAATAFLSIDDCDGDGDLDVWVPWTENNALSKAIIRFASDICGGKPPKVVEITLTHGTPIRLDALDDSHTIVATASDGGSDATLVQTFTLTSATGIREVVLTGAEICIIKICWECDGQIVNPTPTPQGPKPTATPTPQGPKPTETPTPQGSKPTPTPTATLKPIVGPKIDIRLIDVPIEFHRRAANILEELRGSEVNPGWKESKLADKVYPFYRPDIEGVAFYEFTLIPKGAIVVSTGKHDEPLMSLNDNDQGSIGDVLLKEAEKNNLQPVKFYKLDSFGFVAETEDGQMVASFGDLPQKIKGLDPSVLTQTEFEISEVKVEGPPNSKDDSDITGDRTITLSGPQDAKITLEEWTSWQEFRDSYAEVYHVLIDRRMRDVSDSWKVEELIQQNGIVLMPKQVVKIPLLFANSSFMLEGEGASYAKVERSGNPIVLNISVAKLPTESASFSILITHPDQRKETIKFFIPNPETIKIEDTQEEEAISNGSGIRTQSVTPQGWGSWSSWTYYYAGNSGDQRMYYQFTYGGCASGCGATAWAMLFGWADNQAAEGNAYWAPRWGLYRENGGYGSDAVAPTYQDTGIENITKEINGYIDTFCITGSGATYPWKMDNADDYIAGRSSTDLYIHYNSVGIAESGLREDARNSIRDRETPAVIGTGWLQHYPLAWAYAWQKRYYYVLGVQVSTQYNRYFKVNQGWGGTGDGWETASTWFAGEIEP